MVSWLVANSNVMARRTSSGARRGFSMFANTCIRHEAQKLVAIEDPIGRWYKQIGRRSRKYRGQKQTRIHYNFSSIGTAAFTLGHRHKGESIRGTTRTH